MAIVWTKTTDESPLRSMIVRKVAWIIKPTWFKKFGGLFPREMIFELAFHQRIENIGDDDEKEEDRDIWSPTDKDLGIDYFQPKTTINDISKFLVKYVNER